LGFFLWSTVDHPKLCFSESIIIIMFACTSRVATSTLLKSRVVARRWASSEGTGAAKKATEEVVKKEEPVGWWHSAKCTFVSLRYYYCCGDASFWVGCFCVSRALPDVVSSRPVLWCVEIQFLALVLPFLTWSLGH
jgi:hypothetical protein